MFIDAVSCFSIQTCAISGGSSSSFPSVRIIAILLTPSLELTGRCWDEKAFFIASKPLQEKNCFESLGGQSVMMAILLTPILQLTRRCWDAKSSLIASNPLQKRCILWSGNARWKQFLRKQLYKYVRILINIKFGATAFLAQSNKYVRSNFEQPRF